MRKLSPVALFAVLAVVLVTGCVGQSEVPIEPITPTPAEIPFVETPTPTPIPPTPTPTPEIIEVVVPPPTPTPTPTPPPPPPVGQEFNIDADDRGYYMAGQTISKKIAWLRSLLLGGSHATASST